MPVTTGNQEDQPEFAPHPDLLRELREIEVGMLAADVDELSRELSGVLASLPERYEHQEIVYQWSQVIRALKCGLWDEFGSRFCVPGWLALNPKDDLAVTAFDVWRVSVMQRVRELVRRVLDLARNHSSAVACVVAIEQSYAELLYLDPTDVRWSAWR